MRKILTILAGLLLMGSLSSCLNLNKERNYTLDYNYSVSIQDQDAQKEAVEFIDSHFIGSKKKAYFGKLHDVAEQAGVYFLECVTEQEVKDFFYSRIQDEKDYVLLEGFLSSEVGNCWIGTKAWQWSDKAKQNN